MHLLKKMMLLIAFVMEYLGSALSLSQVRVVVPDAVLSDGTATFHCHFDLEGDILYSVKWYKGRQEFYRYTPRETPPIKTFPIPGLSELKVEIGESNATHVTMRSVTPSMSGRYSCEVSADAPSFHTQLVTGQMDVVKPPSHRPMLHGLKARYRIGDPLRVNCTSLGSRPAANISWQLNGQAVDWHNVKVYHMVGDDEDDLETVTSIFEKILSSLDFNRNGRFKIRCTASILSVYWQTTEKSAEMDRPKPHVSITDHRSKPSVQLNLKTDMETISIVKNKEPTEKDTLPATSSEGTSLLALPSVLYCTTLIFQYSFVLT